MFIQWGYYRRNLLLTITVLLVIQFLQEKKANRGYSPWGCKRVGHNLVTAHAGTITPYTENKWIWG